MLSQIGDEYFCYITECKDPKACTILLRGASKDVLMETERNLQDALHVARNIMLNPKLVPGGGAVEMAVSHVCTWSTWNFLFVFVIMPRFFVSCSFFVLKF